MKKLDTAQAGVVRELLKVSMSRELINILELPKHNGGPRFHTLWQGDCRLYVIDLLRDRRNVLETALGLSDVEEDK